MPLTGNCTSRWSVQMASAGVRVGRPFPPVAGVELEHRRRRQVRVVAEEAFVPPPYIQRFPRLTAS